MPIGVKRVLEEQMRMLVAHCVGKIGVAGGVLYFANRKATATFEYSYEDAGVCGNVTETVGDNLVLPAAKGQVQRPSNTEAATA